MKRLCILLSCITLTLQKLKVISPQVLSNQIGNEITYNVASFGKIPWGHRMLGHLDKAEEDIGCDDIIATQTQSEFLLVRRGECTFVRKVKNAQTAGYQFVIIGDTVQDGITTGFTMADDGDGYQITIPSIFIGKMDADFLWQFASNPSDSEKPVILLMKFDVKQRWNVEVLFALNLQDKESFDLMTEYADYYTSLKGQNVRYSLMYQMYQLPEESENCLCKGKYCVFDENNRFSGKEIVREILRQLCLFEIDPDGYFQYLVEFKDSCSFPLSYDTCSMKIMKKLKFELAEILECSSNSFLDSVTHEPTQSLSRAYNYMLDSQIKLNQVAGISSFPSVLINSQQIEGNLSGKIVFGTVCNSFIEPPSVCSEEVEGFIKIDSSIGTSQLINLIVILISILLIVCALAYLIYKKLFKQSQRETEQSVNEMVTQYIKFAENNNTQKQHSK